jgi:trypsin
VGGAVRAIVALVNASSPADDLFSGQFCGGVLVDANEVLTAAHCVAERDANTIDAIIGADNLCRGRPIDGERIHVTAVTIHPRYDKDTARFDLARLALERQVSPSWVRAVGRAPQGLSAGVGVGWSLAARGASFCRLTMTQLHLLGDGECREALGPNFDPESMFCASPKAGGEADTCVGDSGGPVLVGGDPRIGDVLGVVSWGRGCGAGIPGVYARASAWR